MTAAGVAVWYTATGFASGGVYRLYDMTSGACLAEQNVPSDTIVITGGCLGLMDAFLSPSSLWLFLGNLSRDVLVNKVMYYFPQFLTNWPGTDIETQSLHFLRTLKNVLSLCNTTFCFYL
jgi:hypothetical protein